LEILVYPAYVKDRATHFLMSSMLNKIERSGGEAVVQYLDSNLRVLKPGAYVRCAVTGVEIPLDELKYWSVERQEAYASPEAVMMRITGGAGPQK
jgi:hypothetical protein